MLAKSITQKFFSIEKTIPTIATCLAQMRILSTLVAYPNKAIRLQGFNSSPLFNIAEVFNYPVLYLKLDEVKPDKPITNSDKQPKYNNANDDNKSAKAHKKSTDEDANNKNDKAEDTEFDRKGLLDESSIKEE